MFRFKQQKAPSSPPSNEQMLERALETLVSGSYVYSDWRVCTCGHLFAAANGGVFATQCRQVADTKDKRLPAYSDLLEIVAKANGWDPYSMWDHVDYVSKETIRVSARHKLSTREAAIIVVRKGLDSIKQVETKVETDELVTV